MTNKICVFILCGGFATRMKDVCHETPKSMLKVSNIYFIDLIINRLEKYEIKECILCTGHLGEYFKKNLKKRDKINLIYSQEDTPLGTGGAFFNAAKIINESDTCFVLNGDTYFDFDLKNMLSLFYSSKKNVITVVKNNSSRADAEIININNLDVVGINKRGMSNTDSFINAGAYLFKKSITNMNFKKNFSIESDLLPLLIKDNDLSAFYNEGNIYDIGTPERYDDFIRKFKLI